MKQNNLKLKAVEDAIINIEKTYGKGSIMRLGDSPSQKVEVIPTGCISLDYALGVGGVPKGRIIEIYGPEAGGKCVVGDTWILTRKGISKIESYREERYKEGFNSCKIDIYTKNKFHKTDMFYDGGVQDTLKVQTRFGFEIEGTLNHPIYVLQSDGTLVFRELKDLKDTDYVCIQRNQNVFSKTDYVFPKFLFTRKKNDSHSKIFNLPKKVSKEFARFAAYIIAEGYSEDKGSFHFFNTNSKVLEEYRSLVKSLFEYEVQSSVDKESNVTCLTVCSIYIKNFLREHNILNGLSRDKIIPICILHSSKEVIQEFLQVFFDCEGYVSSTNKSFYIEIVTASEELSIQLHLLLLNFGILSNRFKFVSRATNGKNISRDYWRLDITGDISLKRFQEYINFSIDYKKRALSSIVSRKKRSISTNVEAIPYTKELLRDIKNSIIKEQGTRKGGSKRKGKGLRNIVGDRLVYYMDQVIRGECLLSYSVANNIISGLDTYQDISSVKKLRSFCNYSFFFDKITKTTLGKKRVYDFSVPKKHSFFSNGFISHNTTMSLHILAECQKNGGIAAFIDAEHALDTSYARRLGVDVDNLLLSQPDFGEQALEIAETLVRSNGVDIIVVDSVAALTPKAEIEGDMGDPQMALQARLMSQALRKLTAIVGKSGTCLIFINQLRDKIGIVFGNPETTTGGNALKFYSSVRLDVRRIGVIKSNGETGDVVGNKTKIKVVKNKVAPPFREVVVDIIYGKGIDSISDVMDLSVTHGVIEKKGGWYTVGEDKMLGKDLKLRLIEDKKMYEEMRQKLMGILFPHIKE